jgi:hypothetical protein
MHSDDNTPDFDVTSLRSPEGEKLINLHYGTYSSAASALGIAAMLETIEKGGEIAIPSLGITLSRANLRRKPARRFSIDELKQMESDIYKMHAEMRGYLNGEWGNFCELGDVVRVDGEKIELTEEQYIELGNAVNDIDGAVFRALRFIGRILGDKSGVSGLHP